MIVVEGPDGAGKTTLVNHLLEKYADDGLMLGKRGTEDRTKLRDVTRPDTYNAILGGILPHTSAALWDRIFYSELVYSPLMDRKAAFTANEVMFIQRILDAAGFPHILCLPPLDVVRKNLGDTQMEGVQEIIDKIYLKYSDLYRVDGLLPESTILYDYTGSVDHLPGYGTIETIYQEIEDYLDEKQERNRGVDRAS